ncbi:MAG: M55 family metallopeptidase [Longimicrobiales bacterium]
MTIRPSKLIAPVMGAFALAVGTAGPGSAQAPLRIFISVDMEGIGGIGTPAMTSASGKDYATGRELMTAEVNAVVAAILAQGPAEIVVNDSHGDHQNVLHTELDPRVMYTQGAVKPYGMVEGLDETFDGAIFIGYHARAGVPDGFLAHTGSGIVKGLWINDMESGEGEMNAAFAGAHGVPVLLAAGDSVFVAQFSENVKTTTVVTKFAVTPVAARLKSPETVRRELADATGRALAARATAEPLHVTEPVRVRMRFDDTTRPQILEAIPGVKRSDGFTVDFTMPTMKEAYRMIRFMYRFVAT